jgi:23S rRNA pseudouridine1911/1915/1917 synthase
MSLQVVVSFKVLDESEDWLVVDKPAPLIVHPANRKPEPTLLGGIEQLLAFEIENGACPAIVNRLDRDTSGVVLVAKHTAAARELGMIFERREAVKEYLAVVSGWPEADAWQCAEPIVRAGEIGPSEIWVRQLVHAAGKDCLTRFRVENRFERGEGRFSVIRCFPQTGRMHQIRVHLAHGGFPVVGDKIYTDDGSEYLEWMANGWHQGLAQKLLLARHALHAERLCLPWRGAVVDWRADFPADLADFVAGKPAADTPGVVIWSRHD